MSSITESNALFCSQDIERTRVPHKPTRGTSVKGKAAKASNWVLLKMDDLWESIGPNNKKQPIQEKLIKKKILKLDNFTPLKKDDSCEPDDLWENVESELDTSENTGEQCEANFKEDRCGSKFLMTGQQLSQEDVLRFVDNLKIEYPSASIFFLNNSLMYGFDHIYQLDPLFVVSKMTPDINKDWSIVRNKVGLKPKNLKTEEKEEDSWLHLTHEISTNPVQLSKKEKREIKKNKQLSLNSINQIKERYIVYPFVYPRCDIFSYAHIVLIIIDRTEKVIYYYDSQGLTSNDPTRMGLFDDHLEFDMHENLVQLANLLFDDRSKVIENVDVHQTDPFSCGAFVCRAIKRLYQGMSAPEALSFNASEEAITKTRKQMGLSYMQAMQERYS